MSKYKAHNARVDSKPDHYNVIETSNIDRHKTCYELMYDGSVYRYRDRVASWGFHFRPGIGQGCRTVNGPITS